MTTEELAATVRSLAEQTAEAIGMTTEGFAAHSDRLSAIERRLDKIEDNLIELGRAVYGNSAEDE